MPMPKRPVSLILYNSPQKIVYHHVSNLDNNTSSVQTKARGNAENYAHLEYFKMANKIWIISKIVARNHEVPARLAPYITQPVVAEVGHPRPGEDVDAAVGPDPAIRTQTDS